MIFKKASYDPFKVFVDMIITANEKKIINKPEQSRKLRVFLGSFSILILLQIIMVMKC